MVTQAYNAAMAELDKIADPINNDRMLSARLAVRKATGEE